MDIVFYLAILVGKIAGFLSRISKRGAGVTWAGYLALSIYPNLIEALSEKLTKGVIIVSGTNGKTTTTHILKGILKSGSIRVISNDTGANLFNGLAGTLLAASSLTGDLKGDLGVFEVDEGALPRVLTVIKPSFIVLLNLSRDQLDRYGEIDLTLSRWEKSIGQLKSYPVFIVNRDDKYLKRLDQFFTDRDIVFYNFDLLTPVGYTSPIEGRFNQLNTNAAVLTAQLLGFSDEGIKKGLKSILPAFGRGEHFDINNRHLTILLSKNPVSMDVNLTFLESTLSNAKGSGRFAVLFILNDNIPDGRDISWIYDADFEKHHHWLLRLPLFVSGERALDLALRLKYADISLPHSESRLSTDLRSVLTAAISFLPKGGSLYILSTYSGMLEARKLLLGKGVG